MSKFLYGIDFGTTNSALSIYDEENKEIVDTISIPSLIYFTEVKSLVDGESHIVGDKAIDAYLSDNMKGRFIKSIKQILSRTTFTETRIHNKRYTASDLVTLILKDLKPSHRDTILLWEEKHLKVFQNHCQIELMS